MKVENIFVKLIENKTHQILAKKSFDGNEVDKYLLVLETQHNRGRIKITHSFKTIKKRDDAFEMFDENMAANFVNDYKWMFD